MIKIVTSNTFKLRMSHSLETVLKDNSLEYKWYNYDILSKDEVRNLVCDSKNIILENNYDTDLYRYCKYKNCLYVEPSPFMSYGYLFDNEGWQHRSRICKNTEWRNPITKVGMRNLISHRENYGIYRSGPIQNGIDVYIPSKSWNDTLVSLDIFRKNGIRFDKIITDMSFPEETRKLTEQFSYDTGSCYICSKNNGIRLKNCKKVVSDYLESTILSIMQGIIPYSFAKNIISGSHATYEYMGDMDFYKNSVSISIDHADSVVYRLLTEIVPADFSSEHLKINPTVFEFLSLAKDQKDAQSF